MSGRIPGICVHCGKPVERVSHPDDPPPAMWLHAATRRVSCDLYAEPVPDGPWLDDLARAGEKAVFGHTPECRAHVNRSSGQCFCGGRVEPPLGEDGPTAAEAAGYA